MRTRNMASQELKLMAQILGMCLKGTRDKEKFEFFNFGRDVWEKLVPHLNVVLPDIEVHQDVETVVALFDAWKGEIAEISNEKKMEVNIAARTSPGGLTFAQDGRKAWYNKMKAGNEPDWNNEEPQQANWTDTLTKIVDKGLGCIGTIETRCNRAEAIIEFESEFTRLANQYGTSVMKMKIIRGTVNLGERIAQLDNATTKAEQWIEGINSY